MVIRGHLGDTWKTPAMQDPLLSDRVGIQPSDASRAWRDVDRCLCVRIRTLGSGLHAKAPETMLNVCGTQYRMILIVWRVCWSSCAGFRSSESGGLAASPTAPGAFLHFHEDAGDLYVDVRLNSKFERMRVTGPREQTEFLSRVRATLADEPSDP